MANQIFDEENIERLHLYDDDSLVNQYARPLMTKIVTRLFQKTEFNIDDFYLTVFEDEKANAFFVSKERTKDKTKHVIAISRGLIEACDNEAELAGIIGHECGHYVWQKLLGGKDTIFQERVADLRAVDLLINGGYNPLHHLKICERLFDDYAGKSFHFSCDVHGNNLARVNDIEARLTQLAHETGDFENLTDKPDTNYLAFKEKIAEAYNKEGYNNYFEKLLIKTYGTKDRNKLSNEQVLTLINQELASGHFKTAFGQEYIRKFLYQMCRSPDEKSPELTKLCEEFFMHQISYYQENRYNFDYRGDRDFKYRLEELKLEPFGDFLTQQKNIERLVTYDTKEEAIQYAREVYKLAWTAEFAECFGTAYYPYLKAREEKNIGRMLPWDELKFWADEIRETDEQTAEALDFCANINDFYPHKKLTLVEHNDYDYNDHYIGSYTCEEYRDEGYSSLSDAKNYFLDENKIVLLYGEEAQERYRQERLEEERQRKARLMAKTMKEFVAVKEKFEETLNWYNDLARFEKETDETQKMLLAKKLIEQEIKKPKLTISERNYERNPFQQELEKEFYDSPYYQVFLKDFDKGLKISELTDMEEHPEVILRLSKAYWKLADYVQKDNLWDAADIYATIARWMRVDTDEVKREQYKLQKASESKWRVAQYEEAKRKGKTFCFADDYGDKVYYGEDWKKQDEEVIKEADAVKKKRMIRAQIEHRNVLKASKNKKTFGYADPIIQYTSYIYDDFKHKRCSELLYNLMRTCDVIPSLDLPKTLAQLDKMTGRTEENSVFNPNTKNEFWDIYHDDRQKKYSLEAFNSVYLWHTFGLEIVTDKLLNGSPFDLKQTLQYLHCANKSDSEVVQNIWARAMIENPQFDNYSLEDKLFIFEQLENKNLFSSKYANKLTFSKSIVKALENEPNHENAMRVAERLLSGFRLDYASKKHAYIDTLKEIDRVIDFYAKGVAEKWGEDDGSDVYFQKVSKAVETDILKNSNLDISSSVRRKLLRKISDYTISQELTAQMLDDKGNVKFSGSDAEKYDVAARVAEELLSGLAEYPESAKSVIDFLSTKCTLKSIQALYNSLPNQLLGYADISPYHLQLTHENFWSADLGVRAYLMNRVVKAYSKNGEDVLNLVVDMHFDKKSSYYDEALRVVKTVYQHLKPYERDLILAALISSSQKDRGKQSSGGEAIGEGLRMFFESKGSAFVKFGQLLSYLPMLDSDIRRPLSLLRDKADLPTRADFFKMLKETLPNQELAKITKVGKILGAGSFFVIAQVEYNHKPCVVAVMRPYAKELVQSGMNMINETIVDLAGQNPSYKPLLNVARQAKLSATSEIDIEADYAKFVEAVKMYDDMKVILPGGEYHPQVAKWISYGVGKDNQAYKIMEEASGWSLSGEKMPMHMKHDAAMAYTTLELVNLLSGQKWDTDRHQGQQNFVGEGYKKFLIGIFDTGAQIVHSPDTKDKILLGEMLYGMIRAARNGESISEYMLNKVKNIDEAGEKYNFSTLYIDEVQRGLTALSDVITYQKEIKDEQGQVIQKEKSLTSEELGDIFSAILSSGLMDKRVKATLAAKVILNKFRVTRKGWRQSLSEGIKQTSSSITIEKREKSSEAATAQRIDKPEKELEDLAEKDKNSRILGVSLKHIKMTDAKVSATSVRRAAFRR